MLYSVFISVNASVQVTIIDCSFILSLWPFLLSVLNCLCHHLRFTRLLKSWFSSWGSMYLWRWDLIAGLISGFVTAFLSITLIGILYPLIAIFRRLIASAAYPSTILLKRVCFFAVYFSFMSWVTIQYVKRLGLS